MARITHDQRLPIANRHRAHWAQANGALPAPLVLPGGFTLAQLETLIGEFETLSDEFVLLEQTLLPTKRGQRDAVWGLSSEDPDGLWFQLRNYRPLVRALLGARHPLARIVPNLGANFPGNYLPMLQAFLNHWTQVNAVLGANPMVLGTMTVADLQAATTGLTTTLDDIAEDESRLSLLREQADQLYGDEAEDIREPTSIIARLMLYRAVVLSLFSGQPLGDSLPELFPPDSPATLPTFGFNWSAQPDGSIKAWYEAPNPAWNATQVFLKEGADTHIEPLNVLGVATWPNITILDELDQVEFRNGADLTVARGTRKTNLPEPA